MAVRREIVLAHGPIKYHEEVTPYYCLLKKSPREEEKKYIFSQYGNVRVLGWSNPLYK